MDGGPEWTNLSGKVTYSARGKRDVLLIVPNNDLSDPDVVPRRPAIELTQQLREKLENQGIARDQQTDDLTIMKARYGLDKNRRLQEVQTSQPGGKSVTRESVLKQITSLMNNHEDRAGGGKNECKLHAYQYMYVCHSPVELYYIGAGKRNTGDWCFEDGFITFKDLTDLYLQLLRGRVLTIVTDCSHSGCWVRQCLTFLDEQGVGPCGHSARKKRILINVYASCLSHQVPRQLAFSVHTCRNDKNTGDLMFHSMSDSASLQSKIADAQHSTGINFTQVRCGQDSIQEECLCLPQATWQTWSAHNRIYRVRGTDRGRKGWHMILMVDDDETILSFIEKTQGEESGKHNITCADYGKVLKSGWGEEPTDEEQDSIMKPYKTYKPKPED